MAQSELNRNVTWGEKADHKTPAITEAHNVKILVTVCNNP